MKQLLEKLNLDTHSLGSLSVIHLEVVLPTETNQWSIENKSQMTPVVSRHQMVTRSKTSSLPPPRVFINNLVS